MKNTQLYILATVLLVLSVGLFIYKAFFLELPLHPQQRAETWNVQAEITFDAKGGPVKLSLFAPKSEGPFTIIDQSFASEGYGLTSVRKGSNRSWVYSRQSTKGEQTVYYKFVVHRAKYYSPREAAEPAPSISNPDFKGPKRAAANGLLASLRSEAADDEILARLLLTKLSGRSVDQNVKSLVGTASSTRQRLLIARDVLALASVPSRLITGIQLVASMRNAKLTHWLEVFTEGRWRALAPQTETKDLPMHFLPWWRGEKKGLVSLRGGTNARRTLSVAATSSPALRTAQDVSKAKGASLVSYSLFSLPIHEQQIYKIILTIPFGIFFLTIVRNIIGLRTFGTFMPVLIAIAFRETQVLWGLLLLVTVVALALLMRTYLGTLRLLMVPRLSSVLIIVILTMASISVLSNQLGLERGLSVTLFPMVILTMTVERISVLWDERGPAEVIRQAADSVLVAVVAYFIMVNPYAEHLGIMFPEILLALLAGNLLIGRYSGFRLVDLIRFRNLAGKTP